MRYYSKVCSQCGLELESGEAKQQTPAMCKACRDKLLGDMRDARPIERDFPAGWTFDDKIDKARELGMSYGKFVALVHDGAIRTKGMKKAKKITPAEIKRRRRLVW